MLPSACGTYGRNKEVLQSTFNHQTSCYTAYRANHNCWTAIIASFTSNCQWFLLKNNRSTHKYLHNRETLATTKFSESQKFLLFILVKFKLGKSGSMMPFHVGLVCSSILMSYVYIQTEIYKAKHCICGHHAFTTASVALQLARSNL